MAKLEALGSSVERQEWLEKASVRLARLFAASDEYTVPANIRISVGFPKGRTGKSAAIGQCWGPQSSADGHMELFISPALGVSSAETAETESVFALSVLAHEMVHAIVGVAAGHKSPFRKLATRINLEGKMTATVPGEAFKRFGAGVIAEIGTFPMGQLAHTSRIGKQTTRMLKCECSECGYVARVTRKWLDEAGAPICPADKSVMLCD